MKADDSGLAARGYLYYPGCSLRATGVAYEESLLTLFRLLGLPLRELEDWNCCGATSYMSIDEGAAALLSARVLSLARQQGAEDLLAPCSACYLALRKTQDSVHRYPRVQQEVEESLARAGLTLLNSTRIRHPLEVLYTDVGLPAIHTKTVRRWRGGQVACYYGCQLVRPYEGVDKAQNPTRMEELLQQVGVPVVDYALKTKCCGGSLTGTLSEVGLRLNYILLKEAARKGAEAIVTVCPLCQFNLDAYQRDIRQQSGERFDIPILYFTQVLGWALGGGVRELGLHRAVSGRNLIKRWFQAHEPVEAYV